MEIKENKTSLGSRSKVRTVKKKTQSKISKKLSRQDPPAGYKLKNRGGEWDMGGRRPEMVWFCPFLGIRAGGKKKG